MKEIVEKGVGVAAVSGHLRPLRKLRFRMQVLVALSAVPAVMIIGFLGYQERRQVIKDYRLEIHQVAEKLAQRQKKLIENTRGFLTDLAQSPVLETPSDSACGVFLGQFFPLTQFSGLAVMQANGDRLCSAVSVSQASTPAEMLFVRRVLDDGVFSVSSIQMNQAKQRASLWFAVPVKAGLDHPETAGAVIAVVPFEWWIDALIDLGLPKGALVEITNSAGQIVATFPKRPREFGRPASEFWQGEDLSVTGSSDVIHQPDGMRRIFTQLNLFQWPDQGEVKLSLGLPVEDGILAATQRAAIRMASFGGMLIAFWLLAMLQLERKVLRPITELYLEIMQLAPSGSPEQNSPIGAEGDPVSDTDQIALSVRKISKEHKLAETAQKEQAEQLEALLDSMPDNYFRFDRHGIILDYRLRLKISLIKDPIAHIGHPFADLLPPDARRKFEQNFAKHHETGDFIIWNYQLDVDGTLQVREGRLCPISGSDETIFVVRDITKRHIAEQRRTVVEARFERIITNFPGVVMSRKFTETDGPVITYVSPQSIDIWGYTPEEIYADQNVLEATVDPEDMREMSALILKAGEECEPYTLRYKVTSRTGEQKWLETNTIAYLQEDGSTHTDGFIFDVTTEVDARQQLEKERRTARRAKNLKMIGQMTGGVAHEFNNLLSAVMGCLELLRDDLAETEHTALIDAGISATRRGADLTRNMLAFARRARLEPQVIDLNKIVNETRNWSGRSIPSKIEIETSLLTGLWATKADVNSTETSLLNLIANARDAMPTGGRLTIETANVRVDKAYVDARQEEIELGRYAVLSVTDTGHGMSKDTLALIFDPFFTTKPPGSGSGLGLPMIMGFMKQSGGAVQVISERNVGTTVKLYFKALEQEAKTPGSVTALTALTDQADNMTQSGQKILIAEDEVNVLAVLIATLEKAGYSVTSAETGDEALVAFEADPTFDLLLTDVVMPGALQGPALSQVIREQVPNIPVIFMSGYASDIPIHGTELKPEDIHLMKPILRADLLTAIKASLSG